MRNLIDTLYSSTSVIRLMKSRRVCNSCGTHGEGGESVYGFNGKAKKETNHYKI
jgi:hypothetical protein